MNVMTLRTVILLGILSLTVVASAQVTMIRALTLYDSGDPTPEEQLILEYINRARANPTAEGTRLGISLWESLCDPNAVGIRPPLAMNKILLQLAHYHSWDMYTSNYFGHHDLSGHNPSQRMTDAGYGPWTWGENIATGGGGSATNLADDLMVDPGVSCRLHRVNLFNGDFKEVGVGYYTAATPNPSRWGHFLTQDFGSASIGSFLVGVIYNDADDDNFYDIGEGVSGVQIVPSEGSYYAVSSTSGGYAFPIGNSGTMTVTASDSRFGSIMKVVAFNGANIKLDFDLGDNTTATTAEITATTAANGTTPITLETVSITASTSATYSAQTHSTTASSTSSSTARTSSTQADMTSVTTSTTEIAEFQFGYAGLLIAVIGLYAVMRPKPKPA